MEGFSFLKYFENELCYNNYYEDGDFVKLYPLK